MEEREADFDRPETLQTAFRGVERLLLVSTDSLHAPDVRIKQHRAAIQAGDRRRSRHIVNGLAGGDDEIAIIISCLSGKSIQHVNVKPDEVEEGLVSAGIPQFAARSVRELD